MIRKNKPSGYDKMNGKRLKDWQSKTWTNYRRWQNNCIKREEGMLPKEFEEAIIISTPKKICALFNVIKVEFSRSTAENILQQLCTTGYTLMCKVA